jgi:hypothetical protein
MIVQVFSALTGIDHYTLTRVSYRLGTLSHGEYRFCPDHVGTGKDSTLHEGKGWEG